MNNGINVLNNYITELLIENKRYLFKRPSYLGRFIKISKKLKKQMKVREQLKRDENLIVPPILILSITNNCNLACANCYACDQDRDKSQELSIDQISKTIDEAIDLGVSFVLVAGGEPLLKQGILDIPKKHKDTIFVLFTNGLLIDDKTTGFFQKTKNLIPIISIEGDATATDQRRGKGTYDKVKTVMNNLDRNDILFGASITLTQKNFDMVINTDYLDTMEETGCAATFLIEYVPNGPDDNLCLSKVQKEELNEKDATIMYKYNMLTMLLPGNEDKFDGCLAAGRGFIHISSEGAVEACPFAPYSDTNIKDITLKQALQSNLLKNIRDNHNQLTESKGGCVLNENRKWVESLLSK